MSFEKNLGEDNIMVSVCVLTYNHSQYIRQSLDGILMQQVNFKIEVLIHDDASNDGTEGIIKEYADKYPDIIKPLYEKENQWLKGRRGSAVFNFPRSVGKYIALCEGDDYWTDPAKLQKQVDFLDNNLEYSACQHHRMVLYPNGKCKVENLNEHIFTQCFLFRNILDEYYLNSTERAQTFNGDTFLEFYIKSTGKLHYLDFVGAVYRYSGEGIFSSLNLLKKKINSYSSYEKIIIFLKNSCYPYKEKMIQEAKSNLIETYWLLFTMDSKTYTLLNYLKLHIKYKTINYIQFKRLLKILLNRI